MAGPEFHVHVDASWVSDEFQSLLLDELGFWRMDFARELNEGDSYAPAHHLTIKLHDPRRFREVFDRIESFVTSRPSIHGYIEGEVLPLDRDFEARPFDPDVPVPFRLSMTNLPPGEFRQTEVHVRPIRMVPEALAAILSIRRPVVQRGSGLSAAA